MVIRKPEGETYVTNENITVWWAQTNAFANWRRPTPAELNDPGVINMSDAIKSDGYSFGLQASNQVDARSINDPTSARIRGFMNWSGTYSFFEPVSYNDISELLARVKRAVGKPLTTGFIITRVDGEKSTELAENGDFVSVFKVQTGAQGNTFDGENPVSYQTGFMPKGDAISYTILGTGAAVVSLTPATSTGAAGTFAQLSGTVGGRPYTRGLSWKSSDSNKVTVTKNGVVKRIATGTATITATFDATGASATSTITVS